MSNLIIVPVGNPLTFDKRFDSENHWRIKTKTRNYKTWAIQYNDYTPDKTTYDKLYKMSGMKWTLIKNLLNKVDYTKYEYIGFFDDDLITDVHNLNRAFQIATENNFKAFQLSLTEDSDLSYPILFNKPNTIYSRTNFIEIMAPIVHSSLIPLFLELWEMYNISTGWGFDKILSKLINDDLYVIHDAKMLHPKKQESSYNKTNAWSEMSELLNKVFPKFIHDKYNQDFKFTDRIIEYESVNNIKGD